MSWMGTTVDNRLLERWQASRRRQEEARRFLARQRFSDPRGEGRALDEIVETIADLEHTVNERASVRRERRAPTGPDPAGVA